MGDGDGLTNGQSKTVILPKFHYKLNEFGQKLFCIAVI